MSATRIDVESLRRTWIARNLALQSAVAADPYGKRDLSQQNGAEGDAWDAFRDACDELNGTSCEHAECPQNDERERKG